MDIILASAIIASILFLLLIVLPIARIQGKATRIVELLESINEKLGKGNDDMNTKSESEDVEDDPIVFT